MIEDCRYEPMKVRCVSNFLSGFRAGNAEPLRPPITTVPLRNQVVRKNAGSLKIFQFDSPIRIATRKSSGQSKGISQLGQW